MNQSIALVEAEAFGTTESDVSVVPDSQHTLTSLESNAEKLVQSIRAILQNSYQLEISKRAAQLQALQAHINPHFLCNTLGAIKWLILDGEKEQSAQMIDALSKYFRLIISDGRDIVTLRDECDLVKTYLQILNKRFENKFCSQWEVDDSALDDMIPKLTLQPIVENAWLHGLQVCNKPEKLLRISIQKRTHQNQIVIADNGVGMSREQIRRLLERKHSGGYGIANVKERIDLFNQSTNGMQIESVPGEGTTVTLVLSPHEKE